MRVGELMSSTEGRKGAKYIRGKLRRCALRSAVCGDARAIQRPHCNATISLAGVRSCGARGAPLDWPAATKRGAGGTAQRRTHVAGLVHGLHGHDVTQPPPPSSTAKCRAHSLAREQAHDRLTWLTWLTFTLHPS